MATAACFARWGAITCSAGFEGASMCLLQESFDLLGVMEGAGVSPSVDTYNTLMVACKQRHQLQSVPRIFRRLIMSGGLSVSVGCTCRPRRLGAARAQPGLSAGYMQQHSSGHWYLVPCTTLTCCD